MATREELYTALRNADAAGDTAGAQKLAAYIKTMPADAPEAAPEPSAQTLAVRKAEEDRAGGTFRQNVAAGLVRGAGSIGATLLWPVDKATDLIMGDRGPTMSGLITGKQPLSRNEERRQSMTEALGEMGANTNSLSFKGGKLAGEIAGTAGAGGVAGNALRAVAPGLAPLATAISTNGFNAGGMTGLGGLATRTAGGAIAGGLTAGLANPADAGSGALIGGVLPGAMQAVGAVGNKLGGVLRGPEQAADMATAIQAARDVGYVIPPTQARPTLGNRLLEGFSGKLTTAQNASARNQVVTNRLAAETVGLPGDVPITRDALNKVRQTAGQAYDAVASTGTITPTAAYGAALDKITAPAKLAAAGFPDAKANPLIAEIESLKSPQFDASSAVEKIKDLRSQADTAYAAGNKALGKAYKDAAGAVEDAIDTHLSGLGVPPEMLQGFRDARQLIAKTYSVEKALNPTTGSVDARKLAAQVGRGKPMSGPMRVAADFADRFPTAAKPVESMGSLPQTSPLDWAAGGGISAATGNPLMLAGVMARPAARAAILSPVVQNRLIQPAASAGVNPNLLQFGYRAAPLIADQ